MAQTADPPEPTVSSDTAAPNTAESVPDTAAPNTAESVPDTAAEPGLAPPAAVAVGRRLVSPRLPERGMQGLLAMAFAGLLIFVFTDQSKRITRLDDRTTRLDDKIDARFAAQDEKIDARFAAQDEKIDARFAAQDEKIDAKFADQNEKIDEINLKLTALIAALNMSSAVDAAVEGQLADAP